MNDWSFLLKNKVVLVTGAAGALGSAISKTCLHHGARLALIDINQIALDQLKTKFIDEDKIDHESILTVEIDVSKEESIKQGMRIIIERWKTIDVLINK